MLDVICNVIQHAVLPNQPVLGAVVRLHVLTSHPRSTTCLLLVTTTRSEITFLQLQLVIMFTDGVRKAVASVAVDARFYVKK